MIEKIKEPIQKIRIMDRPFSRSMLFGSFGVIAATLVFIFFTSSTLSFPVVLRFNERQGILMFGEQAQVFGIWLSFFVLWTLNALLAEFLYFRERLLSYSLVMLNGFLALFLVAVIVTITLIN